MINRRTVLKNIALSALARHCQKARPLLRPVGW